MRKISMTIAILATMSATAVAQTPPANSGPGNKAVNQTNTNNPGAPVSGANSFTEGQAKSRIEAEGFTDISALKKDDAGVWRGKATKGGKTADVSVDFQGNVVAQ